MAARWVAMLRWGGGRGVVLIRVVDGRAVGSDAAVGGEGAALFPN